MALAGVARGAFVCVFVIDRNEAWLNRCASGFAGRDDALPSVGPMKLPNADEAIVDAGKLRDYCLNRAHPRGRHKARVFEARLGFTTDHVETLRAALLEAAAGRDDAVPGRSDRHGTRYVLDFDVDGPKGRGRVRSGWIVRAGEDFPRFTTCYVL